MLEDIARYVSTTEINAVSREMGVAVGHHVTVRPIARSKGDLLALMAMDRACFDDLWYDAEEFLEELDNPSTFGFLAHTNESKPKLLGYILGNRDPDFPGGHYLVTCGVIPDFRNRRIFTKLWGLFEQGCKAQGSGYIALHSRTEENPGSGGNFKVFQKLGFEIKETIRDHYDVNDDAYLMVKRLNP
jgi:ribosomal protein S18 acetylase RimI-like enzyme